MKSNKHSKWTQILVALNLSGLVSCGSNPYKTYEKKDTAEDATIALEQDDPNKAISILETALESDSQNWQYISLLGMAYAERAGIDAITVAQKMATNSSNTSTSGVVALFAVMPSATDAHITDVDKAVTLMTSIPSASRTTADVLKIAMFETAALTLRTKKYDTDGDGTISAAEALAMSGTDATAILSQLASAAGVFSGSTISSTTDKAASAQITTIQTAITSCPGTDQQAKLKNYLSKTGC
jgi:hypothetical protein